MGSSIENVCTTLDTYLENACNSYQNHIAFSCRGKQLSFAELECKSRKLAYWLLNAAGFKSR